MRKYVNIPLPEDLIKQIEKIIETVGLGYTTKTEFVKEAVREKIMTLSKHNKSEGDKDKISQLQNDIKTFINKFNDDVEQKRKIYRSYAKKFREKNK